MVVPYLSSSSGIHLMPRGNDPSQSTSENPADLRNRADHARRLARDLTTQRDRNILTNFANELERRAAQVEAAAENPEPRASRTPSQPSGLPRWPRITW